MTIRVKWDKVCNACHVIQLGVIFLPFQHLLSISSLTFYFSAELNLFYALHSKYGFQVPNSVNLIKQTYIEDPLQWRPEEGNVLIITVPAGLAPTFQELASLPSALGLFLTHDWVSPASSPTLTLSHHAASMNPQQIFPGPRCWASAAAFPEHGLKDTITLEHDNSFFSLKPGYVVKHIWELPNWVSLPQDFSELFIS